MKKIFIATLICLIFAIVAFFSVGGDTFTSDEVSHIPAGYYYLTTGRYFINNEHPPFVKDLAAIPLLFINPAAPSITGEIYTKTNWEAPSYPYPPEVEFPRDMELRNKQWDWGRLLLFHQENNPDHLLLWARIFVIFFNSLALFVLFLSLRKIWSWRASIIALFLIAVSQFSLAHASLVTLDFMPTIFSISGFAWFSLFLVRFAKKENQLAPFVLAALFFSLAMLSKFSFVLIMPIAFISGLVYIWVKNRKIIFPFILRFSSLLLFITIAIGLFMLFHVRNMDEEIMMMQAAMNYPEYLPHFGLDILYSLISTGNSFLKGLVEYAIGVIMVISRLVGAAQTTYFMGNVYGNGEGTPLYFPVLYFTKLSLGFLFLLIFTAILEIRGSFKKKTRLFQRFKNFLANPFTFVMLVSIYFYAVMTLSSNFQIGLRHIMPIVFASFILVAKGLDNNWEKFKYVFILAFLAISVSTAWAYPRYLEYYNYLGGGVENGYRIATDSNYDWGGQDVKLLGKWAKENNIEKIYADIFTNVPLEYYLGNEYKYYKISWPWLPHSGSYIAVSIFEYQNNIYDRNLRDDQKYTRIKDYYVETVGKTMLIFRIP